MLRREIAILFFVCCFFLACVPNALCKSSSPTINVAGDGSGDFNCHGKNDQIQINQALQFVAKTPGYTTVHLKGPFTYVINDTILISRNTVLEGDSSAVIKLADHAGWPTMKPLIGQMRYSGNDNITVRGFEVNVNHAGNSEISVGHGYYNIMYFIHCNNVKVCNMYLHDGTGDGLRVNQGENVQFYNNTIYKLGHEGLFAISCENVEAWNNLITARANSALRLWNSKNVSFHDNVINYFDDGITGGPGIQIEKSTGGVVSDVEVYNNIINNTIGPGIFMIGYGNDSYPKEEAHNVHIHHNIFYSTGTNKSFVWWEGGIETSGFYDTLIENNVFDGVYYAAISNLYPIDPVGPDAGTDLSPKGKGFTTTIRNNIIVNTRKSKKDPIETGYGVINNFPQTNNFILENNCLYNNSGGNYINCTSATDIYMNSLFADQKNHDYHLLSVAGRWNGKAWVKDKVSSPCINAGYPYSDYSKEPEPNGKRINIGLDGNTRYASKSELTANFNSNVTTGYAPMSVAFTDISTGIPTLWKWNFGDSTFSTIKNPVHKYNKTGKYTVRLTVTNTAGSNTITNPNYIVINVMKPPLASFAMSKSSGKIPLTVYFTDKSTGTMASVKWDFGDGVKTTIKNPSHKFTKVGWWKVSLTATNKAGSSSKYQYLTVTK
jgi:PKD repeat protein